MVLAALLTRRYFPGMTTDQNASNDGFSIDGDVFMVLVNEEGQHSLWPGSKEVPAGWACVHPASSKAEALAYVEANWTDMRPISLRREMDRARDQL